MTDRLDVTLAADPDTITQLRAALRANAYILEPITVEVKQPHEPQSERFVVNIEDVTP